MKAGTIRVYEDNAAATGREVTALGHGAQRSIQMALIRLLAERVRGETPTSSRPLLLIDEPELYLHPQAIEQVRVALKDIARGAYQVLVSTHSPMVIGPADVANCLLIYKSGGKETAVRPSISARVKSAIEDGASQAQMLFSLSHACQVLFSDRIVLTEGTTEQRLVPALFECRRGQTLGAARIGLVPLGGVESYAASVAILRALRLDVRAIVDLDFAFRGAVKAGLMGVNDEALRPVSGAA